MQEVLNLIQKILDSKVKIIQDEQRLRPKIAKFLDFVAMQTSLKSYKLAKQNKSRRRFKTKHRVF